MLEAERPAALLRQARGDALDDPRAPPPPREGAQAAEGADPRGVTPDGRVGPPIGDAERMPQLHSQTIPLWARVVPPHVRRASHEVAERHRRSTGASRRRSRESASSAVVALSARRRAPTRPARAPSRGRCRGDARGRRTRCAAACASRVTASPVAETNVPARPRASITWSSSSARYALATVFTASPSSAARARTVGIRAPGASDPSATASITWRRSCSNGGAEAAGSIDSFMRAAPRHALALRRGIRHRQSRLRFTSRESTIALRVWSTLGAMRTRSSASSRRGDVAGAHVHDRVGAARDRAGVDDLGHALQDRAAARRARPCRGRTARRRPRCSCRRRRGRPGW